ncbi:MAG: hypothetical protein R3B91_06000 [Planctomycetaceae bacterium]
MQSPVIADDELFAIELDADIYSVTQEGLHDLRLLNSRAIPFHICCVASGRDWYVTLPGRREHRRSGRWRMAAWRSTFDSLPKISTPTG